VLAASLAVSVGAQAQPEQPSPGEALNPASIDSQEPPAAAPPMPPPAPAVQEPDESSPEFVLAVQFELIRVGCGAFAPQEQWNSTAQQAVVRFNEHGRWRFDPARPTRGLLAALRRNEARVCPPDCEPGFELRGMSCVAVQQTPTPAPAPSRAAPATPPPRQAPPSRPAPARQAAPPPRQAQPPRRQAPPPRREAQPPRRQATPPPRQAQPAQRQAPDCYVDLGYGRREPCGGGVR
jgi:hypothetical protein